MKSLIKKLLKDKSDEVRKQAAKERKDAAKFSKLKTEIKNKIKSGSSCNDK